MKSFENEPRWSSSLPRRVIRTGSVRRTNPYVVRTAPIPTSKLNLPFHISVEKASVVSSCAKAKQATVRRQGAFFVQIEIPKNGANDVGFAAGIGGLGSMHAKCRVGQWSIGPTICCEHSVTALNTIDGGLPAPRWRYSGGERRVRQRGI